MRKPCDKENRAAGCIFRHLDGFSVIPGRLIRTACSIFFERGVCDKFCYRGGYKRFRISKVSRPVSSHASRRFSGTMENPSGLFLIHRRQTRVILRRHSKGS